MKYSLLQNLKNNKVNIMSPSGANHYCVSFLFDNSLKVTGCSFQQVWSTSLRNPIPWCILQSGCCPDIRLVFSTLHRSSSRLLKAFLCPDLLKMFTLIYRGGLHQRCMWIIVVLEEKTMTKTHFCWRLLFSWFLWPRQDSQFQTHLCDQRAPFVSLGQ